MIAAAETNNVDPLLTEVFRDVFKEPSMALAPDTSPASVKGWDSLAHMRLVMAVEERFGIKFKASEIAKFHNVGELADMVRSKLPR